MELEKKVKIAKYLRIFAFAMACIYLGMWFLDWIYPALFVKLNPIFTLLPSIFDHFIKATADFGYRQIPMGYVWSAITCVLLQRICKKQAEKFEEQRQIEIEQEHNRRFIVEERARKAKEEERVRNAKYREVFFGLLEFHLDYLDNYGKDYSELEKLRLEYCKILVNKLKAKYEKINFITKDKVFFLSSQYNLLYLVTKDILRVIDVFIKVNRDNKIRTNILFSYWVDSKTANKMSVFRALSQINELGYVNKIIFPNDVYLKIEAKEKEPWCQVSPIGACKLFKVNNEDDLDVDLYEMISLI